MATTAPPVTFIDNPHAPEIYSTGAVGFFVEGGNVHIAFEATRIDHRSNPGPVNRVVIARLVMPAYAAQSLSVGLFAFLKKQDMAPEMTAPDSAKH